VSEHTPAPWALEPEDIGPEGGFWITGTAADGAHVTICGRGEWPNRAEMSRANGYLIAAAPELLAAIVAFRRAEGLSPKTGRREAFRAAWTAARAAIAKAQPPALSDREGKAAE
jgi:hypothetical protein